MGSKCYSVENYTRMFQNWTNLNLETIQEQMNLLSINVTDVDKASRIVITTPSPTTTPDSTQTINKNEMMDSVGDTIDNSSALVTSTTAPTVFSSKNEDSSRAPFPCFIKLLYQAIIGLCVVLTLF